MNTANADIVPLSYGNQNRTIKFGIQGHTRPFVTGLLHFEHAIVFLAATPSRTCDHNLINNSLIILSSETKH